jgi:sugar phosphate isomerase/epimerase
MKISVQDAGTCDTLGFEAGYAAIAKAGFEAIDWNIDHALRAADIKALKLGNCIFEGSTQEILKYYAEELSIIRKNNLTITQCHAPFPAYIPGHPEVLEYMMGIYPGCIRFCSAVGIPRIVIHGISLQHDDYENTPETILALNRRLYESLIPALREAENVTVCLENLCTWAGGVATEGICFDPHEACALIDELNEKAGKTCFGLCMDVGHMQLVMKNIRTYAPIVARHIRCLHIHDNDAHADRHLAPFTGTTNWDHVCAALKEIGYRGDLSFETVQQTRKAGAFDKDLVQPWLNVIYATGAAFRKRILA